jgi:hypothetical protein
LKLYVSAFGPNSGVVKVAICSKDVFFGHQACKHMAEPSQNFCKKEATKTFQKNEKRLDSSCNPLAVDETSLNH